MILIRRAAEGYYIPELIDSNGVSSGGNITTSGTRAGDFYIHLGSNTTLTPPTAGPSGSTALGAGATCDASANDASILVSVGFITSTDQNIGAVSGNGATSRALLAAFRGVDPNILSNLDYAYDSVTGATWTVPALTTDRVTTIVAIGYKNGATDVNWTDYSLIRIRDAGSNPAQVYWSGASGSENTFGTEIGTSVSSHGYAITAATARASLVFALYGAPL